MKTMEMQLHHKDNHEFDAFSLDPPVYPPRYNFLDIFLDSHKLQQPQAAVQPPIAEANDPTLPARRLMYSLFFLILEISVYSAVPVAARTRSGIINKNINGVDTF
jgi:hypothetical protein